MEENFTLKWNFIKMYYHRVIKGNMIEYGETSKNLSHKGKINGEKRMEQKS